MLPRPHRATAPLLALAQPRARTSARANTSEVAFTRVADSCSTRTRLEHELPAVVTKAGLRTANGDDASEANVRIVITFGKSKIDYEYVITAARRNGDRITEFAGACMRCVREDAVKLIVTDMQTVLERVRDELRKPAAVGPAEGAEPVGPAVGPVGEGPGEPPTPVGQGTEPVPADGGVPGKRTAPIGAIGGAGIAIGTVGLAGVVAGAVLATRPAKVERVPGDAGAFREVDRSTGGFVLVGVGAALVAGGVAMVVTDVVLRKRRRIAGSAMLNSRLVGFSVAGRF